MTTISHAFQGASTQHSQAPAPLPESTFIADCRDAMPVPRATTAILGLAGQGRKTQKTKENKKPAA